MRRREFLTLAGAAALAPTVARAGLPKGRATGARPQLDLYGGFTNLPKPATYLEQIGTTGFFHLIRRNDKRWVWITPAGNQFWGRGVMVTDMSDFGGFAGAFDRLFIRYRAIDSLGASSGPSGTFENHMVRRMKRWHFTHLGWSPGIYAVAIGHHGQPPPPVKIPFVWPVQVSGYTIAKGVGNLYRSTVAANGWQDTTINQHWQSNAGLYVATDTGSSGGPLMCDFRHPSWETWCNEACTDAKTNEPDIFSGQLATTPWLMHYMIDDGDYVRGLKHPSQEHWGLMTLISKPDPTTGNYLKPHLITWLQARYASIGALNTAWGTSYSAWTGGTWGSGTTFEAEAGHSAFLTAKNDSYGLTDFPAQMVSDLDTWMQEQISYYYSTIKAKLTAYRPGALISPLSSNIIINRPLFWAGSKDHCDLYQIQGNSRNGTPAGGDGIFESSWFNDFYTRTGKPGHVYCAFGAQSDSAGGDTNPNTGLFLDGNFDTQEERGAAYAQFVTDLLAHTTSSGVKPVVGLDWWEFCDKPGESYFNFGLISVPNGNAYDGVEASGPKVITKDDYDAGWLGGMEYGDAAPVIQNDVSITLSHTINGDPPFDFNPITITASGSKFDAAWVGRTIRGHGEGFLGQGSILVTAFTDATHLEGNIVSWFTYPEDDDNFVIAAGSWKVSSIIENPATTLTVTPTGATTVTLTAGATAWTPDHVGMFVVTSGGWFEITQRDSATIAQANILHVWKWSLVNSSSGQWAVQEPRNYGDAITPIMNANKSVNGKLAS